MTTPATRGKRRTVRPRLSATPQLVADTASAFTLCRLPADELRAVLRSVTCCTSLCRLSQCCRLLRAEARDVALWRPILAAFFDGSLPPASLDDDQEARSSAQPLSASVPMDLRHAHPLEVLREQVLFARSLDAQERRLRMLALPRSCGWDAFYHQGLPVDGPFHTWERAMRERCERARLGAARGTEREVKALHVQAYGQFVRVVCEHTSAMRAGATREEATFTHWIRHRIRHSGCVGSSASASDVTDICRPLPVLTAMELLDQRGPRRYDGDYGLLAEFKDDKLIAIATQAAEEAFSSAQSVRVAQREKDRMYAPRDPDEEASDSGGDPAQLACCAPGAHVRPKLLAGLYGGYFKVGTAPCPAPPNLQPPSNNHPRTTTTLEAPSNPGAIISPCCPTPPPPPLCDPTGASHTPGDGTRAVPLALLHS